MKTKSQEAPKGPIPEAEPKTRLVVSKVPAILEAIPFRRWGPQRCSTKKELPDSPPKYTVLATLNDSQPHWPIPNEIRLRHDGVLFGTFDDSDEDEDEDAVRMSRRDFLDWFVIADAFSTPTIDSAACFHWLFMTITPEEDVVAAMKAKGGAL